MGRKKEKERKKIGKDKLIDRNRERTGGTEGDRDRGRKFIKL